MEPSALEFVRIDKWLWAVRICKTRSMAVGLCRREKVLVDDQYAKPSREIKVGQIVSVKKEGIHWQYKVIRCIDKRVGASLANQYKKDITPKESLEKLSLAKGGWTPRREKGAGRPTKKDRRDIKKVTGR